MAKIDLQKFFEDHLTVEGSMLTYAGKVKHIVGTTGRTTKKLLFKCECGREDYFSAHKVYKLHTRSCGCSTGKMITDSKTRHGLTNSNFYNVWRYMIERCHNPSHQGYEWYGAIGISVCGRWRDTENGIINFHEDMGDRPEGFTLDRIDPYGDYTPENCRWVDQSTQGFNKKRRDFNKSGRTGVWWDSSRGKWQTYLTKEGKRRFTKRFDTFEEAVDYREKLELEYYGFILPE